MKPILIGITGRFRSGKDAFYYAVRDHIGFGRIQRLAFGDAIKAELAAALGVPVHDLDRNKDRLRGGIQWWADYRRTQNQHYWTRFVRSKWGQCCRLAPPPRAVIVTDVRDQTEAKFIHDQGGVLVRVVRPLSWGERWEAIWSAPARRLRHHRTETALDEYPFDFTLLNKGTLEDLRVKARRLFDDICAST